MSAPRRYPWDQRAGESDTDYAKFLAYKSLGSARSTDRAYRTYVEQVAGPDEAGQRSRKAPSGWCALSAEWNWKDRAQAWDCSQMRQLAARVATLWITGIETLAAKGVRAAAKYNPGEKQWPSVLETFKTIALHLTPEGVRAVGEAAGLAPPAHPEPERAELALVADDGST